MSLFKSKNAPEDRERVDYNGAVTALTAGDWANLAKKKHGMYALVVNGQAVARDHWGFVFARFGGEVHAGVKVELISDEDMKRRVAEAVLLP